MSTHSSNDLQAIPPSTPMSSPLMYEASDDARKTTAAAISSAVAKRFNWRRVGNFRLALLDGRGGNAGVLVDRRERRTRTDRIHTDRSFYKLGWQRFREREERHLRRCVYARAGPSPCRCDRGDCVEHDGCAIIHVRKRAPHG